MSDLEEGEIEGELGDVPVAQAVAPPPVEEVWEQQHSDERLLAPKPCGRAPYYADPWDENGFKGRLAGGKKKKKKSGAAALAAAGFVDVYGSGACAEVEVYPEAGPIRLADVQNLLLWVLGEGSNPRWCFVKNKPLVKRVVLLAAHGLDRSTWDAACAAGLLPAWRQLGEPVELQARNATLAPGSTVHALLTVPQTRKRRREDGQAEAGAEATSEPTAAGGAAAAGAAPHDAAAELDTHDAARAAGGAPNIAAGQAGPAAEPDGPGTDTPAADQRGAKRMKLAPSDDVSTRVEPQLGGTAADAAPAGTAAAAQQQPGAAATPDAAAVSPAGGDTAAAPAALAAAARGPPRRRCSLPPSHYVLTLEQLQAHNYPLPRLDEASGEMVCPEGFVATQASKGGAPRHDLVAVDCEMCITDAGFELTRVTLVDREGRVLLDELVVPRNPITDHNTRYSGITAEMLEGVTTRLEDAQERFREVVSAETLLVAHSGDNDLQALKIIHANVIDTSVLFPHPRGPPFKSALRVLASRHLMRTIQQGEHDPVEDARAAMDLALLKFERGPAYGAGGGERGDRLLEVLGEAGRRSVMVDRLELLNKHVVGNCSAVVAEEDAATVAQLCKELGRQQVDFVWGQLRALQQHYEDRVAAARASGEPEPSAVYLESRDGAADGAQQAEQAATQRQQRQQEAQAAAEEPQRRQQQGGAQPCSAQQGQEQERQQQQVEGGAMDWRGRQAAVLAELDASLARVWGAAPPGTLVVVVTGQGDTSYSRYLQEQKWRRQQGLGDHPPWSANCEAHLAAVQDRVMCALCFAAVKRPTPAAPAAPAAAAKRFPA